MSTTRREFLASLGAMIGGIALQEAIPFNRIWSFPTNIRLPKEGPDFFHLYEPGDLVKWDEQIWEVCQLEIGANGIEYHAYNYIVGPLSKDLPRDVTYKLLQDRKRLELIWQQDFNKLPAK